MATWSSLKVVTSQSRMVGEGVGLLVSLAVGERVDGLAVGEGVAFLDGLAVGEGVAFLDGLAVGEGVGCLDGRRECLLDGISDGGSVGSPDGRALGASLSTWVGTTIIKNELTDLFFDLTP
jgi:hypothetical protein